MCIEHCVPVNVYHVNAQDVDEHIINVHHYYYYAAAAGDDDDHMLAVCLAWTVPLPLSTFLIKACPGRAPIPSRGLSVTKALTQPPNINIILLNDHTTI